MPGALSATAVAAVMRSNLDGLATTPWMARKFARMTGRKVLSLPGVKTLVLGCAASFFEALRMNPVIEGSTAVSQVCAMPRARVTSVSDPLAAAAGVGPGPGGPARA